MSKSGWKRYKLSQIMDIIGGGTPKTTVKEYWGGSIPWLSVVDFGGGNRWVYKTEKTITQKGLEESSTKILKKGQLVISARGTVGEIAQIGGDMAFNQSCYGLDGKLSLIINDFLYYLLKFNVGPLKQNTHGAVFDTITRQTFDCIDVDVPPLTIQKPIAKILGDLDEKIELNHQMNKTLESIAQAIFKRWFVDEDKNSINGRMGDILEGIESGSRPKGGIDHSLTEGIPSIGAENIDGIGFYDYSKTKYVQPEFFNIMSRGVVKDYDVLVYKDGAYIGRKSMFGKGFPYEKCCVNEHVFILRSNNRANQFFLYFLLKQDELKQLNTNSAQPGLNQVSMRSFRISISTKIKIDRFGEAAKPLIDGIFFNCNQARILSQIRDSLLPKLMSGKIRVVA